MGDLIDMNSFKKKEKMAETKEEKRAAFYSLSNDKYFLIKELLRNNRLDRTSDIYRVCHSEISNMPRSEIAGIINSASETKIEMEPTRFMVALDILMGDW